IIRYLIFLFSTIGKCTFLYSLTDTLHTGDSVSLQCSLFTESCAGEHSVYWFRQSSGESQGVLYTKGERNGQCENSTESQTQSCVYSLFNSNVSHSDAGIYYCAVAACGEILFGKGTELNFRGKILYLIVFNYFFYSSTINKSLECQVSAYIYVCDFKRFKSYNYSQFY
uniref:Ig-like domain-containing protein n=1 Tax=Cyprinus carpio TaxID=7962 RepID=A0A8C1GJ13_CYPCA